MGRFWIRDLNWRSNTFLGHRHRLRSHWRWLLKWRTDLRCRYLFEWRSTCIEDVWLPQDRFSYIRTIHLSIEFKFIFKLDILYDSQAGYSFFSKEQKLGLKIKIKVLWYNMAKRFLNFVVKKGKGKYLCSIFESLRKILDQIARFIQNTIKYWKHRLLLSFIVGFKYIPPIIIKFIFVLSSFTYSFLL